jgi:hypothetical protein
VILSRAIIVALLKTGRKDFLMGRSQRDEKAEADERCKILAMIFLSLIFC